MWIRDCKILKSKEAEMTEQEKRILMDNTNTKVYIMGRSKAVVSGRHFSIYDIEDAITKKKKRKSRK
jgi:dTDP-glucose pyrophosphorylase